MLNGDEMARAQRAREKEAQAIFYQLKVVGEIFFHPFSFVNFAVKSK